MPLCSFAPNSNIYDITPVENIFIEEFMRHAPGDHVKVYIYALKLCYHNGGVESLEDFAQLLHMPLPAVLEAFKYWEGAGLVVRVSEDPPGFAFYNVKNRLYDSQPPAGLYEDEKFNMQLQMLYAPRALKAEDIRRIYDWVDIFKVEREAVLSIVQHAIREEEKKMEGARPTVAKVERLVRTLADQDKRSEKSVKEYLYQLTDEYRNVVDLLKYLGIKRPPTTPELEMYRKWKDEWKLSHQAIIAACSELTKVRDPNMAYLERVLQGLMRKGDTTSTRIKTALQAREDIQPGVNEVWKELGMRARPTPADAEAYIEWTKDWGFPQETVLAASRYAAVSMPRSFASVSLVLTDWRSQGIITPEQALLYTEGAKKLDAEVGVVFSRAGIKSHVTEAHRKLYSKWMEEYRMNAEVVLLAAEYSVSAKNPLQYLERLIEIWHGMGINSVSKARGEHEKRRKAQAEGIKRQAASGFTQREYTDDFYKTLAVDLTKY